VGPGGENTLYDKFCVTPNPTPKGWSKEINCKTDLSCPTESGCMGRQCFGSMWSPPSATTDDARLRRLRPRPPALQAALGGVLRDAHLLQWALDEPQDQEPRAPLREEHRLALSWGPAGGQSWDSTVRS